VLGAPLTLLVAPVLRLVAGVPGQLVAAGLRGQRRSRALTACALMVGAGLVIAMTVSSDGLIESLLRRLPLGFPDIYAVGPGSYAEDLAVRYYAANKAKVDAARADPFSDPDAADLDELVRAPNEERSWQPFLSAWKSLGGSPDALTPIYVQDVELTRPIHSELAGMVPRDAAMVAVDPERFLEMVPVTFVRGDRATAVAKLKAGGAAMVPKSLYESRGIDVGTRFTVNLEAGPEKTKEFEIVGVVELGVLEMVFMYLDPMAGPDSLTASVFLVGQKDAVAKVDPRGLRDKRYRYKSRGALVQQKVMMGRLPAGASSAEALAKLRTAAPGLVIDSVRQLLDRLESEFRRAVSVLRSVGWATLCIAGLGVANVMLMKILRQRRQIGILRSLGLTRGQSAALVLGEAAVIGLVGGLMGVMLGYHLSLMGRHLDRTLFGVQYDLAFPAEYIAWTLAVSAAVCLAASALPARRAARMKIVEALSRR
jgi:hypothetical protein